VLQQSDLQLLRSLLEDMPVALRPSRMGDRRRSGATGSGTAGSGAAGSASSIGPGAVYNAAAAAAAAPTAAGAAHSPGALGGHLRLPVPHRVCRRLRRQLLHLPLQQRPRRL
jgi:hypothetical protein